MLSTNPSITASGAFFHSDWRRHVSFFTEFERLLHPLFWRSNLSKIFSIRFSSGLWVTKFIRLTLLSSYQSTENLEIWQLVLPLEVPSIQPVKLSQRKKHVLIQDRKVGTGLTMNRDQGFKSLPGEPPPSITIIPPLPKFSLDTMHSGKEIFFGRCQTQTLPSE